METNTLILIIVIIVAIVIIYGLTRFRSRGKASIRAMGVEGSFEGHNDLPAQKPGVNVQGAKAGGGILAVDETGKGTNVSDVEAQDDIIATSSDGTPKEV